MTPRATYRFQFHEGFTFADAEQLVPYLDQLGISHVYASPITRAAKGSTHGYDVIDPTIVSPDLGGEDAFRSLVAALRSRGMGVIIDIVPNHMGVAGGGNAWWNDVLANGEQSEFARFFDIDWRRKIVLPLLGEPLGPVLAQGQIALEEKDGRFEVVAYGEHRLPVRPEQGLAPTGDPAVLGPLLDRQHYVLASWRTANDELNWRRFFTVSELAGLRIEDPAVFDRTHALYFRLYAEGLIDGVRVDHVDGLTDPARYCRTLRERLDAIQRPADAPPGPAYIVIEKILGAGEPLSPDWGVDGTSGYDFMEEVAALLHAPEGAEPLGQLWADLSGRSPEFEPEELQARQDMLAWAFHGQLAGCVQAFADLARSTPEADGITTGMLQRAIERLLWVFPVYRTYGTGDAAPALDERTRRIARERVEQFVPPGEGPVIDRVLDWLAGTGPGDPALAAEAVRRFQQLSAPIAAKAVEDTAFYRYGRLLSRNDVGFDADKLGSSIEDFHAAAQGRAERFPNGMLATATHDHKRGEDVRARLAVLSTVPDLWREHVERWFEIAGPALEGIDRGDAYMLLQTLFGAWPDGLATDDVEGLKAFAGRVNGWQEKALREGKLRSSWEAPDEAYEARSRALTETLLDPARSAAFLADLSGLLDRLAAANEANTLVQAGLRYTVPGMPDLYQGTELLDLTLVDPDNRRPVDYAARQRVLDDLDAPGPGAAKLHTIATLLALRREHPSLFAEGDYRPAAVTGPRAGNVLAFTRSAGGKTLACAAMIRAGAPLTESGGRTPLPDWWGDTRIAWPTEALDGSAAALFARGALFFTLRTSTPAGPQPDATPSET